MDLFHDLEAQQKRTPFSRSEEMMYFLRYSGLLVDIPAYASYAKANDTFNIIRANILIRSLRNKDKIEKAYVSYWKGKQKTGEEIDEAELRNHMTEALRFLPYMQEGKRKVYVPTFSRSLNQIYSEDFPKLLDKNYRLLLTNFEPLCIDPFDLYGSALFNSFFTKLIEIKQCGKLRAFYDYDSYTVYIINEQGRLENKICLFDKGLRHKNANHMIERVEKIVDAYFENDKQKFLDSLVENKLISSSFLYKNKSKERKLFEKIEVNIDL